MTATTNDTMTDKKENKMNILKTAECPSLSGRSTLTYNVGLKNDEEIHLSLTGNTGSGIFNKEWVSLAAIDEALAEAEGPITSGILHGLFKGKSSNSSGFFMAVLLKEGLLKVSEANSRHYARTDTNAVIRSLITDAPEPKEKPKKEQAKKAKTDDEAPK